MVRNASWRGDNSFVPASGSGESSTDGGRDRCGCDARDEDVAGGRSIRGDSSSDEDDDDQGDDADNDNDEGDNGIRFECTETATVPLPDSRDARRRCTGDNAAGTVTSCVFRSFFSTSMFRLLNAQ